MASLSVALTTCDTGTVELICREYRPISTEHHSQAKRRPRRDERRGRYLLGKPANRTSGLFVLLQKRIPPVRSRNPRGIDASIAANANPKTVRVTKVRCPEQHSTW
jgi:hypothetical protein